MLSRSIHCCTDKYFISFLDQVLLHCVDSPGLVDPFTHWWTRGLCSLPSTPGSWFTPRTSSATRTARARPRSTSEPRATTTPVKRSSPSSRWVRTPWVSLSPTREVAAECRPQGFLEGCWAGRQPWSSCACICSPPLPTRIHFCPTLLFRNSEKVILVLKNPKESVTLLETTEETHGQTRYEKCPDWWEVRELQIEAKIQSVDQSGW